MKFKIPKTCEDWFFNLIGIFLAAVRRTFLVFPGLSEGICIIP